MRLTGVTLLVVLGAGALATAKEPSPRPPGSLVLTITARPEERRLEVHGTLCVSPELSKHSFAFLKPSRVHRIYEADSGKDLPFTITPVAPEQGVYALEVSGRAGVIGFEYTYDHTSFVGASTNPATHDELLLGEVTKQSIFASHLFYYPFSDDAPARTAVVRIRVPKGWMGVSSGKLVSQKEPSGDATLFEYAIDHDSGRLPYPLAIHPYVITQTLYKDRLPVAIYSSKADTKFAREKLKAVTEQVLPFLEGLMGPFPYPSVRIVEIFPTTGNVGLAAKGLVMLTRKMWFAESIEGDFESDAGSVLIDELAHQWNYYKTPLPGFLAEGVSEYTDNIFLERQVDAGLLRRRMAAYREQCRAIIRFLGVLKTYKGKGLTPERTAGKIGVPVEEVSALWPYADRGDVPITDPDVFPPLYFLKGALAVHALRRELGDESFFKGFRRLFEKTYGKPLTLDQYRECFGAFHTKPLRPFFERWYFGVGIPD